MNKIKYFVKPKVLFIMYLAVCVIVLSSNISEAAVHAAASENEFEVLYEDFETYTSNTAEGMWKSEILTFSADPGMVYPAATPLGTGAAVVSGNSLTSSLNIHTRSNKSNILLECLLYADGKWGIEIEDNLGRCNRPEFPALQCNKWLNISVSFDISGKLYTVLCDGAVIMNGAIELSDIAVIRLYTDYGKIIYDNLSLSYNPKLAPISLGAINGDSVLYNQHGIFPPGCESVMISFTQNIDSASVINNVALYTSDGAAVSAWTCAQENMIFITPADGFTANTDYTLKLGKNISSAFLSIADEYEFEFKISDSNADFELARDDFDLWTITEVNIKDDQIGQIKEGTGDIKWANWSSNDNGTITIESEAGRGKVLKICSDESNSAVSYNGQSVNLTAYTGKDYLKKVPTPGKVWVFSCDIKADRIANPSGMLIQTSSGKYINLINLSNNALLDSSGFIGKIYAGRWYNYTTAVNLKQGICNTYLDGVLVSSSAITALDDNISQIRLYVNKVKGVKQSLWFDNFSFREFDSMSDFATSSASTFITSNSGAVKIGRGSLKNIITVNENTDISSLKDALTSYTDADIQISGNDSDIITSDTEITVTSSDGTNKAQYYASVNGITTPQFAPETISKDGYIRADCEYSGTKKPIMVAAMYNGDKLISVGTIGEDSSSRNINGCLSGGVKVSEYAKWTDLRVFVIDSLSNVKPLTPKSILPNE